ncbi:MAG: THUMP domain-containing protein [Desulfurococcales archaeon]|nr:THUMP domain-containing protein [Desulfurococcales archaeon]
MRPVVIVRYSEIAVKGPATRRRMETLLARNIREALRSLGAGGDVVRADGRILIRSPSPDEYTVARACTRVFGVKSSSPAVEFEFSSLEEIVEKATEWFGPRVKGKVFRVRARRAGSHAFTSMDVERLVGASLLEVGGARVNLESPEYTAYIEIRGNRAYLFDEILEGPGGLPLGSEGPVMVLFSGGFDSTAAAWLLMRRGARIALTYYDLGVAEALERALSVALSLARNWSYGYKIKVYRVDFSDVASKVRSLVDRRYRVLVLRRAMLEHAARLAIDEGYEALATGDNVGQVASQTIRNLMLIGRSLPLPVLRPLAGSDKDEVVALVRRIGLYDEASKQVEVCGRASSPTPHADPVIFEREYSKLGFDPSIVRVHSAEVSRDLSLRGLLELLGG